MNADLPRTADVPASKPVVRLSVNLAPSVSDVLVDLCEQSGLNVTDGIREAIIAWRDREAERSGPPNGIGEDESPAIRALRVHVPTGTDSDALCEFDGEYWPCATSTLAHEFIDRDERRR